jgi:hypothetical protein
MLSLTKGFSLNICSNSNASPSAPKKRLPSSFHHQSPNLRICSFHNLTNQILAINRVTLFDLQVADFA